MPSYTYKFRKPSGGANGATNSSTLPAAPAPPAAPAAASGGAIRLPVNGNAPPSSTSVSSTVGSREFKLALVGCAGVGKTVLAEKLLDPFFRHEYKATIGVKVVDHRFNTNFGPLKYSIWD